LRLRHSLLFGAQSDLARDAAARLDRRAARLARQVLAVDRYGLMERFVGDYVRENPADGEMEGSNTTLAWIEFLRANGIEHAYATGSIAEVLADVNDRVSGQTQQLANSVGWSKDLIAMQLQQDSMRLEWGPASTRWNAISPGSWSSRSTCPKFRTRCWRSSTSRLRS